MTPNKYSDDGDDRLIDRAKTLVMRGQLALVRLRYDEAVEHFASARRMIPDEFGAGWPEYFQEILDDAIRIRGEQP